MTQNTSGCCGSQTCETGVTKRPQTETPATRRVAYTPAVDVIETPDEFRVMADVPGAEQDLIDLSLDDGVLTLRAGVRPRTTGETQFLSREYGVGAYERSFRVGDAIDAERISAELAHGVLSVRLPKAAQARPRKISVVAS
jgi:HSP20 family molecular chaperone IbpA